MIDIFADPNGQEVGAVAFDSSDTLAVGDGTGSPDLWNTSIKSVIDSFADPHGQLVLSMAVLSRIDRVVLAEHGPLPGRSQLMRPGWLGVRL